MHLNSMPNLFDLLPPIRLFLECGNCHRQASNMQRKLHPSRQLYSSPGFTFTPWMLRHGKTSWLHTINSREPKFLQIQAFSQGWIAVCSVPVLCCQLYRTQNPTMLMRCQLWDVKQWRITRERQARERMSLASPPWRLQRAISAVKATGVLRHQNLKIEGQEKSGWSKRQ